MLNIGKLGALRVLFGEISATIDCFLVGVGTRLLLQLPSEM